MVPRGGGYGADKDIEGGELDVGLEDFANPRDIKDERVLKRQAGAALAPQIATEIAALQWMHVLCRKVK